MKINRLFLQFLLISVLTLGLQASVQAQSPTPYGNEWIDYNKTYYKLKVVNTGLHRLSYGFLDSLGLAGTNPQHFQLFRRGKEVAIYVAGEADGRLDRADFVEFYGERNDGRLDQDLYKNPAHQPHQLYSLYTDTAAYFLTVNPAGGKRMQEVNPSAAGKTPEPYHLHKATQFFVDRYYFGEKHGTMGGLLNWMDAGEGYTSLASREKKDYQIIGLSNIEVTGPNPWLEVVVGGVGLNSHEGNINIVSPSGIVRTFVQFGIAKDNFQKLSGRIEYADISIDGKLNVQTLPKATPANDVTLSYVAVTYARKNIFSGNALLFYTDSTSAVNPYFLFNGTSETTFAYDVTDPANTVRIAGHLIGSGKGFVFSTQGKSHKILLANTNKPFKPVNKPETIRFRNIDANAYNYIVLTNKRLMKAVGSSRPAPVEYAAYRASSVGGGYDTLLVHVDQVVDHFHYGEYSSNAIRKFMSFMLTSDRDKQLFIIGKGLKYAWDDYRSLHNNKWSYYHIGDRHPKVYEYDLVPTGMIPSSDVFFSSDFRDNRFEPRVPTGRLPATSPEHIIAYLNKVKEHENLPEGLAWRKNILQLGGGANAVQQNEYAKWLTNYRRAAEGPLFGGNIIEKYRRDIVNYTSHVNVSEEVNAGVSLITFFGHSSVDVSDLEIGFASSNLNGYRNKGKYPAIIMNGCYSGDAFIHKKISFGEDWLITPDRGAISFMAQSYIGGDIPLNEFSGRFYELAFTNDQFFGRTIGEIHKETIRKYYTASPIHQQRGDHVATMTQMVLQGDPAVRLYAPSKPDYTFENNNFSVKEESGDVAIAKSKKFVISINAINLGRAISDSLSVGITRTLANGTVLPITFSKVKPIYYKGKLDIVIPNVDTTASGLNKFNISLDHPNQIDELNESNNSLEFSHFLPRSGISLLAPMDYAIVNTTKVNLIVQSTQLLAEPKGVYFELDTTYTFKSGLRQSYKANPGVLPAWEVNLPIGQLSADSTVFFWRARFDQFEQGEDTVWVNGSFRLIKDNDGGWSQSHAGQYREAEMTGLKLNAADKLEFSPFIKQFELRTAGGDIRFDMPPHGIYIYGVSEIDNACGNFKGSSVPRMFFFVLDNKNLRHVTVPGFSPCRFMWNLYQFGDLNNPTIRANMMRFLNAIPEGQYVVAVTVNSVPFDLFTPELKGAFRSIGSKLIDELKTGHPLAIIGQKGASVGTIQEQSADLRSTVPATQQEVSLQYLLQTTNTQGTITSTLIGPAITWGSLHHNIEHYKAGNDAYKLKLFGINANGNRELLNDAVTTRTLDLSQVDAVKYPHLQLQAELSDTEDRSAPQLRQWMVYYQAAPEGVIRPDLVEVSDEIIAQQANRGRIEMPMAFQNVTPYAFRDSITVEVTLTGEGIEPRVSQFKIEALEGNKTAKFNYTMPTSDLDGNYRLIMFVNPQVQPEQQYQNNIYELNFGVKSKLHPIMDVAFDGVHIMDGELVSPSPLISITMKDENKHVFLENADAMQVTLVDEMNNQKDITIGNNPGEVEIFPATEKNDFRFEFKPKRLENGRYKLVVRGRDITGKASGLSPYEINFEVENESKITNFYPYPNPFSTKTQFIFTLTGGVIPDQFKIQIMTVTGKIVKEIMREEIGPIRIGNNKTEYAWDGTDMYGDKLANGVYLYRVVMPKDAEEMKHIWKKGDKGFVNGYGKIYILR